MKTLNNDTPLFNQITIVDCESETELSLFEDLLKKEEYKKIETNAKSLRLFVDPKRQVYQFTLISRSIHPVLKASDVLLNLNMVLSKDKRLGRPHRI